MDYLRYQLRMLYHCTPAQLEREAKGKHLIEMLRDLRCASMEARVNKQRFNLFK